MKTINGLALTVIFFLAAVCALMAAAMLISIISGAGSWAALGFFLFCFAACLWTAREVRSQG